MLSLRDRSINKPFQRELGDRVVARRPRLAPRQPAEASGGFQRDAGGLVGQCPIVLRQVGNEIGDDAWLGNHVKAEKLDAARVRL